MTTLPPTIDALRRDAAGGGARAQLALGEALLRAGSSLSDYREAEAAIRAAHAAGEADATARLAMLSVMGVESAPDWRGGLALLALAATRGSTEAQGQLRALAPDASRGEADWAALAASVDFARWMRTPARRVLSVTPRIATIADFIPRPACDWIIGRAGDRIVPAQVYDETTGAAAQADARNNSAMEFAFADTDLVIALVRAAISVCLEAPIAALEPTQVLHYDVGQSFAPHYDFMDPQVPGYALEAARGGQRVATFLIYLNDAFEGGETDFPLIQIRAKAPPGGALHFANLDAAGAPDRRTLHAGLAPTSGEKWLLSQWVRRRPGA